MIFHENTSALCKVILAALNTPCLVCLENIVSKCTGTFLCHRAEPANFIHKHLVVNHTEMQSPSLSFTLRD